jgi:hypothetical protein
MITISAQSAPSLSALTVPTANLPDGCQLTPPPPEPTTIPLPPPPVGMTVVASKGRSEFPGNPWFGSDDRYVAKVRQAFERLPAIQWPDGPPLEPKEASKLAWTLKRDRGDIAEAYRASYETAYLGPIVVQAVRYTDAKWATPGEGCIVRGSTVIGITGNPQGECFKAVRNYIQSIKW